MAGPFCKFNLKNGDLPHFAGRTVAGSAVLTTTSDRRIKSISILLSGRAKVRFHNVEMINTVSGQKSISNIAGSDLVGSEKLVYKVKNVHRRGHLRAGTYEYKFNFLLSSLAETSIESAHGRIRYELSLKICYLDNSNKIFRHPITVIKHLDLNSSLHYSMNQRCVVDTLSWNLKPPRRPMIYLLETCYSAYVPGQMMEYTFEVISSKSENFEYFIIDFIKVVTYTSRTPFMRKKRCATILLSKLLPVEAISERFYTGYFKIPATPPTTLQSNLISVEYFLKARTHMSFFSSRLELQLPIIIGTVPIKQAVHTTEKVSLGSPKEGHDDFSPRYELRPVIFRSPLRSEQPFIDEDGEGSDDTIFYNPTYPVYELEPKS